MFSVNQNVAIKKITSIHLQCIYDFYISVLSDYLFSDVYTRQETNIWFAMWALARDDFFFLNRVKLIFLTDFIGHSHLSLQSSITVVCVSIKKVLISTVVFVPVFVYSEVVCKETMIRRSRDYHRLQLRKQKH